VYPAGRPAPQARRLGERPDAPARELRSGLRDDVHADRDIDIGAERIEVARRREGRLNIRARCARAEPLGAFLCRRAQRGKRGEVHGAGAPHELQRDAQVGIASAAQAPGFLPFAARGIEPEHPEAPARRRGTRVQIGKSRRADRFSGIERDDIVDREIDTRQRRK
jgi:hypothetical protein